MATRTHPRDHSTEYNTIEYRQGLARLAERGKLDGIFLADIVGVYDVYRGGPAPSIVVQPLAYPPHAR
jgi:alkanesulfonate monooxygenase SsuD/methylene tetrahydromethanopterin reductase-like flavin-dependent oxidoreductase (luciferase family)